MAGLTRLTHLHLDHNSLEQLGPGWLRPCPLLAHLDLSHNLLASLDGHLAFAGGGQLRSLSLAANQLSRPPALGQLARLQRLSLAANPLDTEAFSLCQLLGPLEQLERLSLADTELASLGPFCQQENEEGEQETVTTATTFSSLTSLDISGNWLALPLPLLSLFPSLEHLSACQQNMTSLTAVALAGLSASLRTLELVNCPQLVSLEAGLFPRRFSRLEAVILRSCPRLEILPAGLFEPSEAASDLPEGQSKNAGQQQRRSLIITASDNGLRWVEPGALPWPEVGQLDLSGNPLHCDCGLSTGDRRTDSAAAAFSGTILQRQLIGVCHSPEVLAGRNVSELTGEELVACSAAGPLLLIGPLEVSVLAVALVLVVLAVGITSFLIYRSGRRGKSSTAAVADVLSPPLAAYLAGGPYGSGDPWTKEKERIYSVTEEWAYLAPACSCHNEDIYGIHLPSQHAAARGLRSGGDRTAVDAANSGCPVQYRTLYDQSANGWISQVREGWHIFC